MVTGMEVAMTWQGEGLVLVLLVVVLALLLLVLVVVEVAVVLVTAFLSVAPLVIVCTAAVVVLEGPCPWNNTTLPRARRYLRSSR